MRRLLAAAFALAAASALAQTTPDVVHIQEVDEDGNQIALTDKSRIVDINSTLNLTLDRSALNKYLEQKGLTSSAGDLVSRIDTLSDVLQRSDESLQKLQQAFATQPGPNASAAERKQHWAQTAAAAADAALLVRDEPELNSYLNALLVQNPQAAMNPIEQYRLVYVAAANIARDLQTQVDNLATTSGVYVQMGAWVETRPIHISGFDQYPQDENYVVSRWNLALSDEEQSRLTAYSQLATKVNADGYKTLLSWKTVGPSIIDAYLTDTKSGGCAASLVSNYDAAKKQTWANADAVQQQLEKGRKDAQDYVDFLNGLKTKYAAGGSATKLSPAAFLTGTNADIQALVNKTTALPKMLTDDAEGVVKLVGTGVSAAATAAQALLDQSKQCTADAKTDVQDLQNSILKQVKFLLGETEFNTAALELGDQVSKLSLSQLPSTVSIPLTGTGKRDAGDHFTLKFAVGAANQPRDVIETRQLIMYRVLWHLDLKANLVWANPQGAATSVKHFQAAPAYNAMLKRGSRKHVLWNSLFDPGIGLNLAALDFNHDDAQELGVAAAVSVIHDFLTAGYGYNVSQGVRYWFFGLRLPVPGISVNGTKTTGTAP
jgi:hypothetical protein